MVDLASKFALFDELWSPQRVANVDDYDEKIAKVQEEFTAHAHELEGKLFLVLDSELRIGMDAGEARIGPAEIFVVPACPISRVPSWRNLLGAGGSRERERIVVSSPVSGEGHDLAKNGIVCGAMLRVAPAHGNAMDNPRLPRGTRKGTGI